MIWTRLKELFLLRRPPKLPVSDDSSAAAILQPERDDRIWCVVANVIGEHPFGETKEIRRGTKHFPAGAKVYCYPPLWGDGYEKIKVIGCHRGSHRPVTMVVPAKWLQNWRVKMVYVPFVVKKMSSHWDDSEESHRRALGLVEYCLSRDQHSSE